MRKFAGILLSCVSFFSPGANGQNLPRDYVVTSWGLEEGLPQSSVNSIVQTRDGYLWLATFGGLVRFDGVQFTVFNRFNSPGMRSDRILTIHEANDGTLWCGTEDGILRYRDGAFRTFGFGDSGQSSPVARISEDARGKLWVGTSSTVAMVLNDGVVSIATQASAPFTDRVLRDLRKGNDPGDGVFFAGPSDIFRTVGDSLVRILRTPTPLAPYYWDIMEDPRSKDVAWIATNGYGVIRYERGRTRIFTSSDGLASGYVRKVFVDRDGVVWALCLNGISRLDGERFHTPPDMQGMLGNDYTSMIQDHEGNYWIGTSVGGLQRFRRATVRTYGINNGLLQERLLSLCLLRNGTLLVGTNCGGIYETRLPLLPGVRTSSTSLLFSFSDINRSLNNNCVWSLFEDSKGAVWVGAFELYRFAEGRMRKFDATSGFMGLSVVAIYEDRAGTMWIGCENGLFQFDGESFRRFTTNEGLAHNNVRSIFEDTEGMLWIGTTNGLSTLSGGAWRQRELPSLSDYVRAIHQESDGTMWFGTYGGGIVRLKDGRMSAITTREGLFDNIVSHIVEDENGNFWMGSNAGISRVRKGDLNRVADGEAERVEAYSLGVADGMKSVETNGGFQPSAVKDARGRIYFPTVQGLAVVSAEGTVINPFKPAVHIEAVVGANRFYSLREPIVLPHDSATIEFRYTALSFVEPRKVRFRYMLEGYDDEWIDAGGRRSSFYTHITPGEHRFRVIAANNDGVWNETGASVDIVVIPPFYMTWWFRGIIVVLFLSVGPTVYALRVGAMKKEQRRQQEFSRKLIESQEHERRRIAAELHDGVGQEALVIRNRAMLAQRFAKRSKELGGHLHEIADTAAEMVGLIREIAHDLRPAHLERFGLTDTLTTNMEQVASASPIAWTWNIDDVRQVLPKEHEINVYRVIQEGIQNIMKHSRASKAHLDVRRVGAGLVVSLRDNGVGFDADDARTRSGLGLATMKERARLLNGVFSISSRPGETHLQLSIPARHGGSV